LCVDDDVSLSPSATDLPNDTVLDVDAVGVQQWPIERARDERPDAVDQE
jgi:hypothetical protein